MHFRLLILLFSLILTACLSPKASIKTEVFPHEAYWRYSAGQFPLVSAHRAQPEIEDFPENSLAGIDFLTSQGTFLIEIDVMKSKDGVLFLFHDKSLERLTRNSGQPNSYTWSQLDTMRLLNRKGELTESTIPSFAEALAKGKGKALFAVDRKAGVSLSELAATIEKLGMQSSCSMILYNATDYLEWKALDSIGPVNYEVLPDGSLYSLVTELEELYARKGYYDLDSTSMHYLSVFSGVGQPAKALLDTADYYGVSVTTGTFRTIDRTNGTKMRKGYKNLLSQGVDVIATNKPISANKAIAKRQ